MKLSSPQISFDNRLLAVEELFRQRQHQAAAQELSGFSEHEFESKALDHGLFLLLSAERHYYEGNYRKALECGLRATRLLADYPFNRRYGRTQLVLSKSYSALGDLKNAEMRARDALAAYRRAADPEGQVDSLNELARIQYIRTNFRAALNYLKEALPLITDNPRKVAQITGNLGRLRGYLGMWQDAETDLKTALEYHVTHNEEISQAINLLSLGQLYRRRRLFAEARREYERAHEIIVRLKLKREKIIYLEFAGELAYDKGDMFKAKTMLSNAYQKGLMLAPGSSLVSQSSRRLAEVELALDNIEQAMKYGQKGLELALALGEKVEIGLCHRVIAQVFAAKGDYEEAQEHIRQAVDVLRQVGDPYDLAHTLLVLVDIGSSAQTEICEDVRTAIEEAHDLFRELKLDYWAAESDFKAGVLYCQRGDLATGFKKLSRAEKIFSNLKEHAKLRAVHKFLQSLAEQAVALSVSQENDYKIFGNYITPSRLSDIQTSSMEDILNELVKKTGANRAVLYLPDEESQQVVSSFPLAHQQLKRFNDKFRQLLGEEVSRTKPTLILDARRDPYLNQLFADIPDVVASVIVVPFKLSGDTAGYVYLDRLTKDNGLNPFSQKELNFAVGFSDLIAFKWAEIQKNKLLEDNLRLKNQLKEKAAFPNIITQNSHMLEVLAQARQVVDSNIAVTIEGETGTGKDLLAQAIHFNSCRSDKRFISVNCAALPETLLESELFGYKRGAFTGADRDKAGLFEEADGGTFFLDEIADMPLSIQAKLLRVLEAQEIVRLGETVPRKVDVRIISATNKDLKEQMQAGLFRPDLYYRLSALRFRLPPLRERKEDIPLLIAHFLEGTGKKVSTEMMKRLVAYDWPGNVRELENEVKKLVLLAGDRELIDTDVAANLGGVTANSAGSDRSTEAHLPEPTFSSDYSLYDYLAEHEKRFIIKALRETGGIKKHAAALLNIPESTLRLKIKQYDIDVNAFAGGGQ
jgi:Nif-specific regulatory protein